MIGWMLNEYQGLGHQRLPEALAGGAEVVWKLVIRLIILLALCVLAVVDLAPAPYRLSFSWTEARCPRSMWAQRWYEQLAEQAKDFPRPAACSSFPQVWPRGAPKERASSERSGLSGDVLSVT